MSTRSVPQLAILCSTALAALVIAAVFLHNEHPKAGDAQAAAAVVALSVVVVAAAAVALGRHKQLSGTARAELAEGGTEQYLRLAEEYRRLSDLAITAQEHADLKLSDVSAQLDHLRGQVESLRRILSEVE
jgi:hypothetical protein